MRSNENIGCSDYVEYNISIINPACPIRASYYRNQHVIILDLNLVQE